MALSKRERVDAALVGQTVDRPPVSAWRHFIPQERAAAPLADISLRFFHEYDWDWLKVNPRATYYAEAWGARYDFDDYTGVLPRLLSTPLQRAADLAQIAPISPTEGVFAEQLDLVRRIYTGIGGAHFVQTVFSPLSVLAFLIAQPGDQSSDLGLQSRFTRLRALLHDDPAAVHAALEAIASTLAGYAAASIDAGASGIFYAIVRLAREEVLTREEYAAFGKPYDLQVLKAVQGAPFNLLHICGPRVYFDLVTDYPVHAFNWAAIGQENLSLAEVARQTGKAVIGGVDEHGVIQHGTPDDVIAAAHAAIAEPGVGSLLLAPGCGLALDVPNKNLLALRQSVEPITVAA